MNISAPINNTGYGIASTNIIKKIYYEHTKNISVFAIGGSYVDNQNDYDLFSELVYNSISSIDINAPYLKIWHQFDLLQKIGKGKYFAFPFFELDKFNDLEKKHMSVPDTLFVTSNWAKKIVTENNISTNIEVCPLGVDTSIFDHTLNDRITSRQKYIFLNIGKWEVRKGHDILFDIFHKAFPDNDDVELWILASENTNSYSSKEDLEKWKKKYNAPNIKLFSGFDNHGQIANLIAQTDCGIYPSRAEGWNLELLETMAMNKPVIATDYSAHTEFCNQKNCYLVDINETEPAFDGKAFKGQGSWAKIDQSQIDQIIDYMRYVYSNNIRKNSAGIETAEKYSWSNSANIIYRCMSS
jgi:glycosyltransferase involved in cell wall biosynthesis